MRWIYMVLGLGLFLSPLTSHAQGSYEIYHVAPGVTIEQVLKESGMSYAELIAINPEAQTNFSDGLALVVALPKGIPRVFRTHKVKKRETLFGIAKKYGISIIDLKTHNEFLLMRGIVKGDPLSVLVPKPLPSEQEMQALRSNFSNLVVQSHSARPKETLTGIARLYGLTLAEIRILNPGISDTLAIGQSLQVKKVVVATSAVLDQDYFYYQVLPREGFFRLKQKLGITKEQIVALNPYAQEGLKLGMILKIPNAFVPNNALDPDSVDLRDFVRDSSAHRISVLLPFQLTGFVPDSLHLNEQLLQDNKTIRVALDFYSGVLMAAEEAKAYGISVALDVYDTQGKPEVVRELLATSDLGQSDAVIGPLLSANVVLVANALAGSSVPVISPLSNRSVRSSQNVVETLPKDEVLERHMIDYLLEHHQGKQILYIGDETASAKTLLLHQLPNTKVLHPQEQGFIRPEDILEKLSETKENWVVLSSKNPVILSSVIGVLNGMTYYQNQLSAKEDKKQEDVEEPAKHYLVRLFTTDKNAAFDFDDITNLNLANLNFTFPSVSKPYALSDEENPFLTAYKAAYGIYPNRFAVRGYDVTIDVLLRLSQASGDLFKELQADSETEYIENKFRYQKNNQGSFVNQAFYLLRINADLEMVVVNGLDVVLERPKRSKQPKK